VRYTKFLAGAAARATTLARRSNLRRWGTELPWSIASAAQSSKFMRSSSFSDWPARLPTSIVGPFQLFSHGRTRFCWLQHRGPLTRPGLRPLERRSKKMFRAQCVRGRADVARRAQGLVVLSQQKSLAFRERCGTGTLLAGNSLPCRKLRSSRNRGPAFDALAKAQLRSPAPNLRTWNRVWTRRPRPPENHFLVYSADL